MLNHIGSYATGHLRIRLKLCGHLTRLNQVNMGLRGAYPSNSQITEDIIHQKTLKDLLLEQIG